MPSVYDVVLAHLCITRLLWWVLVIF